MITIEEPLELESDTNPVSGESVADVEVPMLDDSPTEEDTVFFRDGLRRIDFVLAYVDAKNDEGKQDSRKEYEDYLKGEGLELEYEKSEYPKTSFLKIHAPWEVLATHAERLRIKVPFKENDIKKKGINVIKRPLEWLFRPFRLPEEIMNPEPDYFTAPFEKDKFNFFRISDKETMFPPSTRNRIVYYILSRCPKYKEDHEDMEDHEDKKGIKGLQTNGTYQSAFPLHDSGIGVQSLCGCAPDEMKSRDPNPECESERVKLYEHWARFRCFYKEQPLNLIRKYYGEKIGIYFALLGFYNTMLLFASVAGLICFIYSIATYKDSIQSKEICDPSIGGEIVMCPLCDKNCSFWTLNSTCTDSLTSHLGDNEFTVFFAIFMGIWVTLFLEFWKRRQARLEYEWDLVDIEEEEQQLLPGYKVKCKDNTELNPITQEMEPHLPVPYKYVFRCLSGATVILWIALICACITGVIVYRLVVYATFASMIQDSPISKLLQWFDITPQIATSFTASCINFIIMVILSFMYEHVAIWLTDKEIPKTHLEYENRLTTKMFLFHFVNYYSSCFYVAFFKGRSLLVGYPGDYNYMFGTLRNEECDPGGCLIELSTQLGVVMVLKQALGIIQHMLVPRMHSWWVSRKCCNPCHPSSLPSRMRNWWSNRKGRNPSDDRVYSSWEQDHDLQDFSELGLFYKYLDMVIQFGFITLFVTSFPLAPLLALIKNILEVRVRAWKLTTQLRRPVAAKARSIGVWLGILKGIAILSVITNAFIVSFTSDMIPRLVYQYAYQPNNSATMEGYINNSLSVFHIYKIRHKHLPKADLNPPWFNSGINTCRYRDYRYPSGHEQEHSLTMQFWHILAAKLAFIIIMLHLVFGVKVCVGWMIPEVRSEVMAHVKRERYLVQVDMCNYVEKKREEVLTGTRFTV